MNNSMLRVRILFEGWRMVQHSYGQVLAFTLIHMYKLYGPNGKLGHKIDFYVTEAEYFRPEWNKLRNLFTVKNTMLFYET